MKKHTPITEVFEVINTAHLSSLSHGSKEPATDLRKWLIDNRTNMSPECATFLNELGVKKKGFALALKQWFSQYHQRQCFIREHEGKPPIDWLSSFGEKWSAKGGVFYFQSDGEKSFTDEEVRQAHKIGVVSVSECSNDGGNIHLEVLVGSKAKLQPVLKLLDQCALPIEKMSAGAQNSVMHIELQPPTVSELNRVVSETALPHYASILLKQPV